MEIDLSEFRRKKDTRCVIGRAFDSLTAEDVEKLQAAMKEQDISNPEIVEWLKKRNLITANESVRKHRTSRCRCD
jgi:hypothetical protein